VSAARIASIDGLEILDSRGRPTVQATVVLEGGARGRAAAPSGASTGVNEALELRDGDPARHRGLGCRRAVANVRGPIAAALAGRTWADQAELDAALGALDGTPNRSRLGANALLAVSLAFARAVAAQQGVPLYEHMAAVAGGQPALPRPMINLFSGGKHAGGQIALQDVQVMPLCTTAVDDTLAIVCEVFARAAELVAREHGMRLLTADEGGLAPDFAGPDEMLGAAVAAIDAAGLRPGKDVALTLDVAASHFAVDGGYALGDRVLDGAGMIARVTDWVERFPVVSVEDGLAEDDWAHWPRLAEALRGRAVVLGDDLLCTNAKRVERAIAAGAADALLLKVNQVGTLTEAADALRLARSAGWRVVVSARSGETEDDWLADLAVGWGADHIKVGSITQSERLAKYNRLLAIEHDTDLRLAPWVPPGRV
jgi:enolase